MSDRSKENSPLLRESDNEDSAVITRGTPSTLNHLLPSLTPNARARARSRVGTNVDDGNVEVRMVDEENSGVGIGLEAALDQIGTGWFHWKLLLICGFGNASDAVEMMALGYIGPTTAQCDYMMDGNKKAWLNSSLFIGMIIGGILWGSFSDNAGRRRSLMVSLLLNGFAGVASAFVPEGYYGGFLSLRLISGIGVGGSIPVLFAYFCEFLPSSKRAMYLVGLATFWMVGQLIAGGLAWGVIGTVECFYDQNQTLAQNCELWKANNCEYLGEVESWRLFTVLAAMPAILSALMICTLPESPKWLQSVGRDHEAERVIITMIATNKFCACNAMANKGADLLSGDDFRLRPVPQKDRRIEHEPQRLCEKISTSIKAVGADMHTVFMGPDKRNARLLLIVWTALCFGFYGVTLWLPDYYAKNEIATDEIGAYQMSFFVAVANLPGNLIAIWSVQSPYVGIRWTLICALIFSAISVFSIMSVKTFAGTLAASCAFNAVSVPAWNALNILTTDSFRTKIRGSAFGQLASAGRVAAILGQQAFGQLSSFSDAIPLIMTGVALAIGAVAVYLVPDSTGKRIDA